ncbi:hypothetical protein SPHINGOAX6_70967 [Sphingomonas sp. AX6]|nr:hypothetical protein SPHINGOAX6_70967 [Sphingomonas sp. AX6]
MGPHTSFPFVSSEVEKRIPKASL